MAEINERPSKIRKLDPCEDTESASELVASRSEAPEHTQDTHSEPREGKAIEQAEEGQTQNEDRPVLSKSQLKKIKKAEAWAAGKEYRKTLRREKHKEKQALKAEERAELQQKIANGEIEPPKPVLAEDGKPRRPKRPIQVPVALVIDCSFDDLMTEKEIISLAAQLTRCYSENRKAAYRTHLVMNSWSGALRSRFENVLANTHLLWKGVKFYEEDFEGAAKAVDTIMRAPGGGKLVGALSQGEAEVDSYSAKDITATAPSEPRDEPDEQRDVSDKQTVALSQTEIDRVIDTVSESINSSDTAPQPAQPVTEDSSIQDSAQAMSDHAPSIVYLTSDSPHTLTTLSPNTSYIIGGIVDKNRHKGICYKRARERGIATAKLPIGEYMTMQSRSVLAINHVVEIMLNWLETGDWGEAFLRVIPKRKEAKLKQKKSDSMDSSVLNDNEQQGEDEMEDLVNDMDDCEEPVLDNATKDLEDD